MDYAKPLLFFAGSAAFLAAAWGISDFIPSPYMEVVLIVLGIGCVGMLYWGFRLLGDSLRRRRRRRLPKS